MRPTASLHRATKDQLLASTAFRPRWQLRSSRHPVRRDRGEQGATLVEMMVVLLTLAILLAISMPIVATLLRTTSRVDVTYSNVDQQLWLSTNLQRLVRSAVAPAPTFAGGVPVPAFVPGALSPTSMTFFSDTGTTNGPQKVVASCSATSSDPTRCSVPTATFTIKVTSPAPTTCPHTTKPPLATSCTYTTATKAKSHFLVQITHVKNGANGKPLFVFAYGPEPTPGSPMTTTTICALRPTPTHAGCTSTATDATVFSSSKCAASSNFTSLNPFSTCPAGQVETVDYDLQINANTSTLNGGNQAEDDTGVFVLSSRSMLFDPTVG